MGGVQLEPLQGSGRRKEGEREEEGRRKERNVKLGAVELKGNLEQPAHTLPLHPYLSPLCFPLLSAERRIPTTKPTSKLTSL